MSEILVIETIEAGAVTATETQIVSTERTEFHVVAVGEQGPQGTTRATVGAPASSTAPGTVGEIRVTAGFVYVCVATDLWQRTALSNF